MKKSVILTISFFPLITFLCFVSLVSSVKTLILGDSLNSSASLVSANNLFTLGFYKPQDTNKSYLGIWYTNYALYPVWLGNRERPIMDNSGILTISSAGKLIITSNGEDLIELYAGGNGTNITATLLNSGNFVVKEININGSEGRNLWESFDYPTDTLLPGMKLGVNRRTGRNWHLTSWFSENNPATGAFTLEWDPGTRRLIIRRRGLAYWTSGDLRDYTFYTFENSRLNVKEFENISLKPDALNLNYNFTNVSNGVEDYFSYYLIIDPKWTSESRKTVSGWRLNSNGDVFDTDRPSIVRSSLCYGYYVQGSSAYKGCELWEQPSCRNHDTFVRKSGNFLYSNGSRELKGSSYEDDKNASLTESDCRANCWKDCECVGFRFQNDYGCSYWRGKNLIFEQSEDGSSLLRFVLVPEPSTKRWKTWKIITLVLSVVVLLLGCVWFIIQIRKKEQGKREEEEELRELMTLEEYTETHTLDIDGGHGHQLRQFSYSSILTATCNFSSTNKLGEGGFGLVYKGKILEAQEIAVKVLSQRSGQGLLEFKTELILISKIQHVNLVKLLGFCIHGDEKMIIYDYMPNKSLDFFLFSPAKRELLNWDIRFNIIEGIAQGLLYLHKYSRLRIIHRDLKAGNILLDKNMNPKISDFGLAKIFKENVIEANTNRLVGTYGYMAPEYAMQGTYSIKSDVYSFGVLIIEIVSGRKNNSFHDEEGPLNLVEYAWELWSKDAALELMDPMLKSSCSRTDQLQRCIHVGLLCLENRATDRPTIEDVISMLKNEMMVLPGPNRPAFVTRNNTVYELDNGKSKKFSANGLSMSAVDGR